MKTLNNILSGIEVLQITGSLDKQVTEICFDSRAVANNSLFIAVKGFATDGHNYIDKAIEGGAMSIIYQNDPVTFNENITYIKVKDSHRALGAISSNFFDNPSSKLRLVGVTGTNGKTSIATLLFTLFTELGYKCGLLSTIRNKIGDKVLGTTHTTPDPVVMNRLMKEMNDTGCEYCFMEVSSHAVDQQRIAGLHFEGGIFTNLTRDHLDYHETFENYLYAKKLFFDNLPASSFALVNTDDRNGGTMIQNCKAIKKSYGIRSMADFKCNIIECSIEGMQLRINGKELWIRLIGEFNAYNILAVYATAVLLGQNSEQVLPVISNLKPVQGRFQLIFGKQKKTGIVDYAHTPDALENILNAINEIRKEGQQIITVVGAGGNRDKGKRPIMAKISANLSDKVILTSDNPRNEVPDEIIKDMRTGIPDNKSNIVLCITDRREAIKTACLMATENDIILVAGKGHENYQEVKGVKHHFDDAEELEIFLNQ